MDDLDVLAEKASISSSCTMTEPKENTGKQPYSDYNGTGTWISRKPSIKLRAFREKIGATDFSLTASRVLKPFTSKKYFGSSYETKKNFPIQ